MITHRGIKVLLKHGAIAHRGNIKRFQMGHPSRVAFKTWCALILGDFNREELLDHIYGDREDGGPSMGVHQLDVRFVQWAPEFKRMELELTRDKRGGTQYFRLVPTFSVAETVSKILHVV